MPQFLCTYSPPRATFAADATDEESAVIAEHFAYLEAALEDGTLVLAGRTQDAPPMGIAVFEAETDEAARAFIDDDPAVRAGIFSAEVRPYRVALLAGGATA